MTQAALRELIRHRYTFRCGYCNTREIDAGAELTLDHFQPRSRGGTDTEENLVYCCHACNEFKTDYWQPDSPHRILHTLRDAVNEHLVEEESGLLRGLSETGVFHVNKLQLNRPALVFRRLEKRQETLLQRLESEVEQKVRRMEQRVEEMAQAIEQSKR